MPHSDAPPHTGDRLFVVTTLVCAVLYLAVARVALDDAYIYFRLAENWLTTGAPVFNTGDHAFIVASPAWLAIVTVLAVAAPAAALPALAKLAFVAALCGASWLLFHILKRGGATAWAPFAATAVFFATSMPSLAGYDTALALLTGLGVINSFQTRSRRFPLWAAAFYLTRPEGAVLAGILGLILLWEARRDGGVAAFVRRNGRSMALGAAAILSWHAFHVLRFGDVFPDGGALDTLQVAAGWRRFVDGWTEHVTVLYATERPMVVNIVTVAIGLIGMAAVWRTSKLLVLWPALHVWLCAAVAAVYHPWLYYPVDLLMALCGLAGIGTLADLARRRIRENGAALLMAAAALVLLAPLRDATLAVAGQRDAAARFDDPQFAAYRTFADHIRAHPPADGDVTLLTHEIGILGWLLPAAHVRDVVGRATPAATKDDFWNWERAARAYTPDYVVGPFPGAPAVLVLGASGAISVFQRVAPTDAGAATALYAPPSDDAFGRTFAADAPTLAAMLVGAQSALPPAGFIVGDRVGLFLHAPSRVALVAPPGTNAIDVGFGYQDGAWAGDARPDGATFIVRAAGAAIFSQTLTPVANEADRGVHHAMAPFPGGGPLTLEIETGVTGDYDWTYWQAPRFRVGDAWVGAVGAGAPVTCPTVADLKTRTRAVVAGWIDALSLESDGVTLRGWAGDITVGRPADLIAVVVGGEVAGCLRTGGSRPDVAAAAKAPGLAQAGFDGRVATSRAGLARADTQVFARLADGSYALLGGR